MNHSLPSHAREAASIPFGYRTSCPRWTVHRDMPMCHWEIQLHRQGRLQMAPATTSRQNCRSVLALHQGSPQETTVETGTRK